MVKYVHKRMIAIDKFFNNDDDGKNWKRKKNRRLCWFVLYPLHRWHRYILQYWKRIKSTVEVHYCKVYVWNKGFICSDKNISSVLIICLYYLGYKYYVNLSMVTGNMKTNYASHLAIDFFFFVQSIKNATTQNGYHYNIYKEYFN